MKTLHYIRESIINKMNISCLLFTLAIVIFCANFTWAAVISFPDFTSTEGLTLNGETAVTLTSDGTVLRLVPATYNQSGSVFGSSMLNVATFSTAFQFRITNPGGISDGTEVGADGFLFMIQPVGSSVTGPGGYLGILGISPSVGVEFDNFYNIEWDPSTNHVGIDINGDISGIAAQPVNTKFDDSNLWYAWIDYDGATLEVRANQIGTRPASPLLSYALDISSIIGTNTAYVGFTAGTGSAYANFDIISWGYRDSFRSFGVPEPSTLFLLGAGLAGIGLLRRRFKN